MAQGGCTCCDLAFPTARNLTNITDLVTELFCKTDDALTDAAHHSQSIQFISELVTIGVLQAMKNISQRALYHWLKDNYGHL